MHCSPSSLKVAKLRSKGLTGHIVCVEGFGNCMFCRSEKLNGSESFVQIIVHNSIKEISWEV